MTAYGVFMTWLIINGLLFIWITRPMSDDGEQRLTRGLEYVLLIGAAAFCSLVYFGGKTLGAW